MSAIQDRECVTVFVLLRTIMHGVRGRNDENYENTARILPLLLAALSGSRNGLHPKAMQRNNKSTTLRAKIFRTLGT